MRSLPAPLVDFHTAGRVVAGLVQAGSRQEADRDRQRQSEGKQRQAEAGRQAEGGQADRGRQRQPGNRLSCLLARLIKSP